MITPPTDCYFTVQVQGEAAEFVTAALSMGAMADIREAVLISEDFNNDIAASNGLDNTMNAVRQRLPQDLTELITHNPLFIPSTPEELDDVLDGDVRSEHYQFVGMDGNPFTLKTIAVTAGGEGLMLGRVACKPFELPPFSEIVARQANETVN